MTASPASVAHAGADVIAQVAALSNEELVAGLDGSFAQMAAAAGDIVVRLGEVSRRQAFRDEGATSVETWVVERYGVSVPSARALAQVGEKAWDLPHLVGSLCAGEVSLDKVKVLADVATPESDRELAEVAKEHSVRQLGDVARAVAAAGGIRAGQSPGRSEHDRRFVRFNEALRTMSVQLPAESFAETRACLEARAHNIPSEGETPWDQRLCDAFMELIRAAAPGAQGRGSTASPYVVVVHTAFDALLDEEGETSALAGDLERGALISTEVVRRIACDATMAIAVDDDVGHTMYEGRARREPSEAQRREVMRRDRHCRFPGCTNVTFTNIHHVLAWKPGGTTDLHNLALMCLHHHHVVHSRGWTMTGNANEQLSFVGPSGRVMVSRPSPMWTRSGSFRGEVAAGEAAPRARPGRAPAS